MMEFRDSSGMTFLEDFINNKFGYDYDIICPPVVFTVGSLQNKELTIDGEVYGDWTGDWAINLLIKNLKFEGNELEVFNKLVTGYYDDHSHSKFKIEVVSVGFDYNSIKVTIYSHDTNEEFARDIANSLTYDYLRDDDDPSYIKDKNEVLGIANKITDFLTIYIKNACKDVSNQAYDYLQTLYK